MDWHRRAQGPSGELRFGYKVVAQLGAWDIAPSGEWGKGDTEGKWSFVAECETRDAYWLEYGSSFTLVLVDLFGRELRFKNLERVFNDEKIGAWGVGPPEEIA
jgi:hypothetical protein